MEPSLAPSGNRPLIQQPRRNPLLSIAKVMVPLVVLAGGLAAAWFMVPSVRQTIIEWVSPQTETAPSQDQAATSAPTAEAPETKLTDDEKRYRDVNVIRIALSDYYIAHSRYPANLSDLIPNQLTTVPRDPSGKAYRYVLTASGYSLVFTLDGPVNNLSAGQHNVSPKGIDQQAAAPPEEDTTDGETEPTSGSPGLEPASAVPVPEAPSIDPELDSDSDGLTDLYEKQVGSDPNKSDTDGDGLTDSEEVNIYGTNPLLTDSDGDGHSDKSEIDSGFDPTKPDAKLADTDNDGLYDLIEITRSYNPNKPDTDGDGLADGDELNVYGTSPVLSDTDGDKFSDGDEVAGQYNPLGSGAADAARLNEWRANEAKYGLHEPTLTTIGR